MTDDRSVLRHILTGVQCALLLSATLECAVAQESGPAVIGQRREAASLPTPAQQPMLIFRGLPEQGQSAVNPSDSDSADFLQRQARGRWLRNVQPNDPEHVERPRMTRDERRQLRQDIRQAGYEVYPSGDSQLRGRSSDSPAMDFPPPGRRGRP